MTTAKGNIPNYVLNKAKALSSHTEQEIIQAKERIPKEYHDFLIMLPQKVKVDESEYKVTIEADNLGMFSSKYGTFVPIEKPYMTVDGRVAMARAEHAKAGKKLFIQEPHFQSLGDRLIVSVTVESEIHGTSTGTIEVGESGPVDKSNPFANAQTSAIGRALGFMGYGLVGTGVIATAEEMAAFTEAAGEPVNQAPAPQSNSKAPIDFRCKIVGEVVFNQDGSSTVPALLMNKETVDLIIPINHKEFAGTLYNEAIINIKGWYKEKDKRIRVAPNDPPQMETKQAS